MEDGLSAEVECCSLERRVSVTPLVAVRGVLVLRKLVRDPQEYHSATCAYRSLTG